MKKSREEILRINPIFTELILDIQLAFKPEPYTEGESVILDSSNDETILTKELADKLNLEELKEFEKKLDSNPFTNSIQNNFIGNQLMISSENQPQKFLSDVAILLEKLRIHLNEDNLVILNVHKEPWLSDESNYKPYKDATSYLSKKIDVSFNGGFTLKATDLIEFIPHLFWLVRCNNNLAYVYMTFPNAKTIISICRYGVLHFSFYDITEKSKVAAKLNEMGFTEVERCYDPVKFDSFEGRFIRV